MSYEQRRAIAPFMDDRDPDETQYVYIKSERYLWTVGFYDPDGKWHAESDHDSPADAAARVAYLNGRTAR